MFQGDFVAGRTGNRGLPDIESHHCLQRREDGNKYSVVMAKFDEHFIPKRNVIYERAKFHSRVQLPGERVEAFVRQLYELAENCDFVKKKEYRRAGNSEKNYKKGRRGTCTRCGRNHDDRDQCPAKGKKCMKCNKVGHFAAVCHSKAAVQEITEADEDECLFLGSVEQEKNWGALLAEDEPPWRTTLILAHTPVSFKIDSGADTSVMSEATFETLQNKPKLTAVKNTLQSPGGAVATRGQFLAKIKAYLNGQLRNCCFRVVVVKTSGENLLSQVKSSHCDKAAVQY
ncbi:Gag-Pol polyprotein [Labeo rohita]|uniref:Gag-Pol polyprotein n=1 Tax=Labeo rohita TaxID=84645 RepID=A0ABQ8L884_LABRO|nr:Gag-Pol polyprotein [Labeo rohita]